MNLTVKGRHKDTDLYPSVLASPTVRCDTAATPFGSGKQMEVLVRPGATLHAAPGSA